ncbi:MAG: PQQ-binding-like beta-propeller repeat protein [Verrucomicrobiae bacterium]|nr:PQQ-binding-like beta-propeller repeat protein [Verrucomicrobiae bacterium]
MQSAAPAPNVFLLCRAPAGWAVSPVLAAILFIPALAPAGDWPNWRGPNQDGSALDEKDLPVEFSKTKNVKWVADLPGEGASTPVVSGDAVFLTSADEAENGVFAFCFDRESGELKWKQALGEGIRKDDRSNFAAPSATTDGKTVYFFTGGGDLAAFDFSGKEIWKRNIQDDYGQFAFGWTFSTSPLLHGGKLYMQVLQRDTAVDGRGFTDRPNESYLLALDPATGKELWKVERPSDAQVESREAFTSPVVVTHGGKTEIVVIGGDYLTGHDPETGKEIWRWGTWNPGHGEKFWRLVPSPVYGDGILLACAPKKQPVYAIKAGGKGKLSDADVAWVSQDALVSSDVPTPLFYEGRFYILNEGKKTLNCVEPATGKVIWSETLDAKVKLESSPTAGDGKIYLMSHLGEVFVVAAGDKFKLLHSTTLGESQSVNIRSSIVPSHGHLFIRTDKKLFCIGK